MTIIDGPRISDRQARALIVAAAVVCFWLFALLAIAGALTARGRRIPAYVVAVPALVFLSVVLFVFETPRYRTGIDPFIVMLAGVALVTAWDEIASRLRPPWSPARARRASTAAARQG